MKTFLSNHYNIMYITIAFFIGFGLIIQPLPDIIAGYANIIISPHLLITDYLYIGGFGVSLVNAGIVTLIAVIILKLCKHEFKSGTISNLWLLLGFSLFGKNPLNVLPIWLGGYIFAKLMGRKFDSVVLVLIVATALGPVVGVPINLYMGGVFTSLPLAIALSVAKGLVIGIIFEPMAVNMLKVHQGFNLYNGGLTAGILAIAIAGVYSSFGINIMPVSFVSTSYHNMILIFTLILCAFYIFVGVHLNGSVSNVMSQLKTLNKTKNDYLPTFGSVVYVNMGLLGLMGVAIATVFALFMPGSFIMHGPALGGILSTFGFGANGKNLPSALALTAGVVLAAFTSPAFAISDPGLMIILFFVTCLSPIPTTFGLHWGVLAGFFHVHIATSVAAPSGGMNLYNNGLAAGFVVMVLLPFISALVAKKEGAV